MDDKYQQLREALAERSKMRGLDPESLCGFNGKQILLADIHSLLAERDGLLEQHHRDSLELRSLCASRDRARTKRDALREALMLTLPLAKGYAAANRVGSNQQRIEQAEAALSL